MKTKKIAPVMNFIIIVFEIVAFIVAFIRDGLSIFCYYTEISNFILLIACSCWLVYKLKKIDPPKWVLVLKYVSVCMVIVTFCMVTFAFVPYCWKTQHAFAIYLLFGDTNIFFHTLCPILAVVSYLFFEKDKEQVFKSTLIATGPTLLYAIVSTSLNVAKLAHGPYAFLYVYEQPVALSVFYFFMIPFTGWIFACLVRWLHRKINK